MNVTALGFRTDLIFHRFDGVVTDRGDHLVIRAPGNPSFYWGNLLYFAEPPGEDDVRRWPALFRSAFADSDQVRHMTFSWDSRDGSLGAAERFVPLGYGLEKNVVLTAGSVQRPAKCADDVIVRRLESDEDFERAIENHMGSSPAGHEPAGYEQFIRRQFDRWRRMSAAGLGGWWGAFAGDRLAGELGLYFQDGLGRFQAVGTHPDFRRRGVCGRLVHEAARRALANGCERLVMVADADDHAVKIYETLGFKVTERSVGVCLPAPRG